MAAASKENPIPVEHRSRPLGKQEAGRLLGFVGSSKAVTKRLKRRIDAGGIVCYEEVRQNYIFDVTQFPPGSQSKMKPPGR